MKTKSVTPLLLSVIAAISLSFSQPSAAQAETPAESKKEVKAEERSKKAENAPKPSAAAQQPLPADPEARFKELFTKATLSGRWAPLKDGALGEERSGDKYQIASVTKDSDDYWTVHAKLNFHGHELVIPIPVQMKFVGDTAILEVKDLTIPGGGTYNARLLIYEKTYSGTWKGLHHGGMLYGTITNEAR